MLYFECAMRLKFNLVLLIHHFYWVEYNNKFTSSYSYKLEDIKDDIFANNMQTMRMKEIFSWCLKCLVIDYTV